MHSFFSHILNFFYRKEQKHQRRRKVLMNIPTRNNIPDYYFIGTLYNKEKNRVVQLYGRERYKHMWDYYIVFNGDTFTQSQIYLEKMNTFGETFIPRV